MDNDGESWNRMSCMVDGTVKKNDVGESLGQMKRIFAVFAMAGNSR
jgi:hypothetical protein